jgi:competence protein ComEC
MPSQTLTSAQNKNITLEGLVSTNPHTGIDHSDFILKTKEGKIRVSFFSHVSVSYGDSVSITGVLKAPENFVTETGKVFDYKHYLEKDGIFFILNGSTYTVLDHPTFSFKRTLFTLFNKAHMIIERYVSFPENTLTKGVLLGDDNTMPKDMEEAYVRTGTIHIVALSGYNISILLTWILLFARRFLSYRWGTLLGIFGVFLFVIGTGGSQTAIRAGIMGGLALIANYYGRPQAALRLLLLTYVGMILLNPFILPYDVSFHLSFLATFGIITFQKKFEGYFIRLPRIVRELLATTLSAQLLVLPYLVLVFGQLSLISVLVNILIGPLVPILMFGGTAVVLIGGLFAPFGTFLGFLVAKISWLLTAIVTFFAKVPHAFVIIPHISWWLIVGIYFFILWWYISSERYGNAVTNI